MTAPRITPRPRLATAIAFARNTWSDLAGISIGSGRRTGSFTAERRSNARSLRTVLPSQRSTEAVLGIGDPPLTPLDVDDPLEVTRDPKADFSGRKERSGLCPVPGGRGSIDEYSESEIVAVVRWIESDTLLRTEQELLLEVMHQLGFHRRGSKIESAITAAIAQARDPQWKPVRQRMRPPPAPRPPRSPYPPQRRRRYW